VSVSLSGIETVVSSNTETVSAYLLTFLSYVGSRTLVSVSLTVVESWTLVGGVPSGTFVESFWHFLSFVSVESMIQQISYIRVVMPIFVTTRSFVPFLIPVQNTPAAAGASTGFIIGGVTGGVVIIAFVAGIMIFFRRKANQLGPSDEIPDIVVGGPSVGFTWTNRKEKEEFSSYSWSYSYSCSDFYSEEEVPPRLAPLVVTVEGPGLEATAQGQSSRRIPRLGSRVAASPP
jgi:hypothetical protein